MSSRIIHLIYKIKEVKLLKFFWLRSVYKGKELVGTATIGEGLSAGIRWDYKLSNNSGIAFGDEQLILFEGLTDS